MTIYKKGLEFPDVASVTLSSALTYAVLLAPFILVQYLYRKLFYNFNPISWRTVVQFARLHSLIYVLKDRNGCTIGNSVLYSCTYG